MSLLDNQRAAEDIDGLYMDLEARLMQNIVRHIQNYDQPIPTDEWLLQKLAEIGRLDRENLRIIGEMAGISNTAAQRMLEEMAEKVTAELEPGFQYLSRQGIVGEAVTAAKSRNVKQVMKNLHKQAKDTLNLCNTTMLYKAREAYKTLVQRTADLAGDAINRQELLDTLNQNASAAIIGGQSRAQVVRQCIREFNAKGIPAFVDRRGREWTPEAYVNMAMRTTSGSVASQVQMARCEDYGIDLVEVDSHSGARPKCARDQGKIFDRANKSSKYPHWNTSSYGEPDGLLGINCGHRIYPYIEGVSIRRYFPAEDLEENDKLYQQVQVQRGLERAVRKQKRECMLYDELGDKEAFEQAAVKLKGKEAQLKQYVAGNDQLHRRRDREQVVGFDKRISSEAVSANKQYQKEVAGKVDESRIAQKNQKAAENWAKNHLGVKKTNYTKQSVEAVNNTNRALQRLYRENPVLQNFVDEIEFKDNMSATAQASLHFRNGQFYAKLTFSSNQCADEKTIQQLIDREVDHGYWTDKRGLYGIAKHEGTHLSEYALTLKRYGVNKDGTGGDAVAAMKAIKKHEIANEIKQKALTACSIPDDPAIIEKKLCGYANVSSGEFLAEACSEYKPRKLAAEVQRLFREEMEK